MPLGPENVRPSQGAAKLSRPSTRRAGRIVRGGVSQNETEPRPPPKVSNPLPGESEASGAAPMMEDEPAAIDSGFTEEFGEELEEQVQTQTRATSVAAPCDAPRCTFTDCSLLRQAGRGKPGDNATARPGDWDCHECGAYNYAFRAEQCFRCHAAKPAEPGGLPAPSGGPVAGGAGAQGANGHGGGGERRPGDWTCPSCQVRRPHPLIARCLELPRP